MGRGSTVIRNQAAFDKAREKRQRTFDAKIAKIAQTIPAILRCKYDGVMQGYENIVLMLLKQGGALGDKTDRGTAGERQCLMKAALDFAVDHKLVTHMKDRRGIVTLSVEYTAEVATADIDDLVPSEAFRLPCRGKEFIRELLLHY